MKTCANVVMYHTDQTSLSHINNYLIENVALVFQLIPPENDSDFKQSKYCEALSDKFTTSAILHCCNK